MNTKAVLSPASGRYRSRFCTERWHHLPSAAFPLNVKVSLVFTDSADRMLYSVAPAIKTKNTGEVSMKLCTLALLVVSSLLLISGCSQPANRKY